MMIEQGEKFRSELSFAALIMGDSGTRKTTTALQFPRPLVIDVDNNLGGPVRLLRSKNRISDDSWFYGRLDRDEQGNEVRPQHRWPRLEKLVEEAGSTDAVRTIVIDSLSSVNDDLIAALESEQTPGMSDRGMMSQNKWMPFAKRLKRLIARCRTFDKLLVVIAHEKTEKDDMSGMLKPWPDVQGSSFKQLPRLFSDWWQTTVKGSGDAAEYKLLTRPTTRASLKNSLELPAEWTFDAKELENRIERVYK